MRFTKEQLDTLADNGAFEDFADFDGGGFDADTIEESVRTGALDFDDLPDFAWQDYL